MRDKGLTRPHGLPQQRNCARGDRWPDTLEGTARCTVRLPVLHADAAQRLHAPPRSSCRRTVRGAKWFFSAQKSESLTSTDLAHDVLLPLACVLDLWWTVKLRGSLSTQTSMHVNIGYDMHIVSRSSIWSCSFLDILHSSTGPHTCPKPGVHRPTCRRLSQSLPRAARHLPRVHSKPACFRLLAVWSADADDS